MRGMWIYTLVPILYAALFLYVRGGFLKAAQYVNHKFLGKLDINDRDVRTAILVIFAANAFAALITLSTRLNNTAEAGYLLRDGYNGLPYTENLELSISGEEKPVEIVVEPRTYTDAEKEEILDRVVIRLRALALGEERADHVAHDVKFVDSYEDTPIVISWTTDRPDILDWDGKICEGIPEGGTNVVLAANVEWGDLEREVTIPITVYPKELSETEAFRRKVNDAVDSVNSTEEEKLYLPGEIEGETVTWRSAMDGSGPAVLFIGLLFAALFLYSKIQNREIEAMKRREELLYDYPLLVNKLVLLLSAGMSMRGAFEKIAGDYQNSVSQGGEKREGFEEIVRLCGEMNKGVAEIDAYRNLGARSAEPKYRTFSTLLVQNMRKGSGELTRQLAREAEEAFEERKKRARILGEQAGTKLMFPMMLMLMVVFAILIVPAMTSFG
ncbi:MAG: type II secretion system F family protein [Lachnospiraceae bacterium]|nr:type II secretion system F family protein [Lachnospiraceae bacterium]